MPQLPRLRKERFDSARPTHSVLYLSHIKTRSCHPERSEGSPSIDEILRFAQDDRTFASSGATGILITLHHRSINHFFKPAPSHHNSPEPNCSFGVFLNFGKSSLKSIILLTYQMCLT